MLKICFGYVANLALQAFFDNTGISSPAIVFPDEKESRVKWQYYPMKWQYYPMVAMVLLKQSEYKLTHNHDNEENFLAFVPSHTEG